MCFCKIAVRLFLSLLFFLQVKVVLSEPLEIISQSVVVQNNQTELVIANPIVITNQVKIQADQLVYNKKEKTAFFDGNVVAQTREWILKAKKASTAAQGQQLLFEDVALFDGSKWYIKARKAESKNGQIALLEKVRITQCKQDDPYWEIYLASLELDKNRTFATGYHGSFFFHSVPLFYLPVIFSPTVTERKSGFLVPEYLQKNSDNPAIAYGSRLRIPYFFALDQQQDLTLTLDWIEKRGEAAEVEYNYAFFEGMRGQFLAWQLNETRTARKIETENLKAEQDPAFLKRYKINYQHRQQIFFNQQLFLDLIKNSDNEINNDFFQRNTASEIAQKQRATLNKSWLNGGYSLTYFEQTRFLYQSRYDLETDEKTALSQTPSFFIFQRLKLFDFEDLEGTLSNQLVNFYRRHGWRGWRNYFKIDKKTEKIFFDILSFEPIISYNVIHYQVNNSQSQASQTITNENEAEFTHTYFDNTFFLSMSFIRDFYNKNKLPEKRLSITPKIKYRFVSDFDQRNALNRNPNSTTLEQSNIDYINYDVIFDQADRIYAQSNYSFILETMLNTRNFNNNRIQNTVLLRLEDTYNLLRKDTVVEQNATLAGPQLEEELQQTPLGEQRLPMKINLEIRENKYIQADYFGRYDHKEERLIEQRYQIKTSISDVYSLGFYQNFNQSDYQKLNGDQVFAVDNFGISNEFDFNDVVLISAQYQWDNQKSVNFLRTYDRQDVTIRLNNCCYALLFSLEQKRINTIVNNENRDDWETLVSFKFTID